MMDSLTVPLIMAGAGLTIAVAAAIRAHVLDARVRRDQSTRTDRDQ